MPHRVKRELKELYWSATLMQLATAGLALFETIYLWTLGYDLQTIVFWWMLVYVFYFFLIPIGGKLAKRFGHEKLIASGAVFYIVYLAGLYSVEQYPWMLFVAALLLALDKSLYWPAFHVDFARNIDADGEGEQISGFQILTALATVVGPIVGGVLVQFFGFGAYFVVASIFVVLSNWPMLRTKEKVVSMVYPYLRPYKLMFSKSRRRDLFAYLGFGEELVAMAIWPIFVYVVVGSFLDSGVVIAVATGLTAIITFSLGRVTDRFDRRKIVRVGVLVHIGFWIARLFPLTAWTVTAIDTGSRVAKNSIAIPIMAMIYEDSKHEDPMDQILVFEMGLIVGKALTALLIFLVLFATQGFEPFFVVAAVMTILYILR